MELAIQLRQANEHGSDVYINAHPPWHPPGAPGIFGGLTVAQCLSAAQETVPPTFVAHSLHGYFVLAGHAHLPIQYHVDRVRDGKAFAIRSVQARQGERCIFTATLSFMKPRADEVTVEHQLDAPREIDSPPAHTHRRAAPNDDGRPYQSVRCPIKADASPADRKLRQWIRAVGLDSLPSELRETRYNASHGLGDRSRISQMHLAALAYISDAFSIGTVARVHNLVRYSDHRMIQSMLRNFKGSIAERELLETYLEAIAREEREENEAAGFRDQNHQIGMMVSLSHTIYFHHPQALRADRWMLSEVQSPWAGAGRGLMVQRIWSHDGVLVATCMQEGVVRLRETSLNKL